MELLDVNVLVALALDTHVHHRAAHRALAEVAGSWATCPTTENGLLRVLLNPRVTGRDFSGARCWRSCAACGPIRAGASCRRTDRWRIRRSILGDGGHRQVTDFHLVDVAARHSAQLATFDAGLVSALAPADRHHVVVWSTLR